LYTYIHTAGRERVAEVEKKRGREGGRGRERQGWKKGATTRYSDRASERKRESERRRARARARESEGGRWREGEGERESEKERARECERK